MATADGWRPTHRYPEVAFAGRSNVGKSSLLNSLVRRKAFARVSKTPGRTREINFFAVNGMFVLADLPGYGYAKISKERQAEWRPLIEGFLRTSPMMNWIDGSASSTRISSCFSSSRLKMRICPTFIRRSRSSTARPKEPVPPVIRTVFPCRDSAMLLMSHDGACV